MLQIIKQYTILFVLWISCLDQSFCAESPCADWTSYKDEKCFKVIDDTLRTYDEAEKACAKLENSPTLAIIHSQEEQDFLVNYLFRTLKKVDNVWVGAKFFNNAFLWIDNSSLTYSNWDSKGPHKKVDYCVEMLPDESTLGKWIDGPCERKNAFVCQKAQTWTMARLQETLLETRKQLTDAQDKANKKIESLEKNLSEQKQNSIPLGFIYTQLPNEKSPTSIWPTMTWTDVSSTFAGVFFRVEGNGSEAFGKAQTENAPRLVRLESTYSGLANSKVHESSILDASIQNTKTSNWIWTGDNVNNRNYYVTVRLVESTGEVRPRNMAIRLWKRTG